MSNRDLMENINFCDCNCYKGDCKRCDCDNCGDCDCSNCWLYLNINVLYSEKGTIDWLNYFLYKNLTNNYDNYKVMVRNDKFYGFEMGIIWVCSLLHANNVSLLLHCLLN